MLAMNLFWVKKKLLNSITMTILAILLLCSLLLFYLINHLTAVTKTSRQYMAQTLMHSGDVRIEEMLRFLTYIDLSSNNVALKAANKSSGETSDDMYRLSALLYNYCEISSIVEDIYIYYTNINRVVGALGCYSPQAYYALTHDLDTSQASRYYWYLSKWDTGLHLMNIGPEAELLFVRVIRYHNREVGYIVVTLSAENILGVLDNVSSTEAYGIVCEGLLLAYSGDESLLLSNEAVELESRYGELSYLAATSAEGSLRGLSIISAISFCSVLLLIAFGLVSSSRLLERQKKPISELGRKLGIEGEDVNLSQINEKVETLLDDKQLSDERLNSWHMIVSGAFLEKVLKKEVSSLQEIVALAKASSLTLDLPCFVMAVLDCEQIGPRRTELLKNSEMMAVCLDGCLYIFIPLEEDAAFDQVDLAVSSLASCQDGNVDYAISPTHNSLDEIRAAAQEAHNRLKLGLKAPDYQDITVSFLRSFDSGDYSRCCQLLGDLFNSIFTHHEDEKVRRLKFSGFSQHLSSSILTFNFDYSSEEALLESVARGLGKNSKEGPKEGSAVAIRAHSIIQQRYRDSQFGLFELAEELGVSNTYVSSQFKKYYGYGVASYISFLRIEEAKRLITTTDLSIKEIALSVGFSSDIAFVRAFKRSEAVTPGSLRKNQEG